MAERKEKPKPCPAGSPAWMTTFSDMNQLLLCFFVLLVSMMKMDISESQLILSAFQGSFGVFQGGKSISEGRFANLGNTLEALPSTEQGRGMAKAYKQAVSLFESEIKNRKVKIDINERGIIISLSNDVYFKRASADLDIDTARTVLEKISLLLTKTELSNKQVRIEGHTDKGPTDPDGPWETNWDLAAERSLNVLKYLIDFGVNPANLAAVSYGEYQPIPLLNDDTEEGMARNRRVDVLILRD